METGHVLIGSAAAALFGFLWIGAPILLTAWVRNRRREVATRQIALTDALDAALGAIVAPVVKKPLWGPWQIHIALPLLPPSVAGKILAVTHDVLSAGDPPRQDQYQVVLTPRQDPVRIGRAHQPVQLAGRQLGRSVAA